MKKLFWSLMLVLAVTVVGCEKKDNPRPNPNEPEKPDPNKPDPENPAECDWADYLISLEFTAPSTTDYEVDEFDYSTMKHKSGKYIHELLGFDDWDELAEAIGVLDGSPETGSDVLYMGNDPVTGYDITDSFNTNAIGYWCNAQGSKQDYNAELSRIFTEIYPTEEGLLRPVGAVGTMPGQVKGGDSFACRMVFQSSEDEVIRVGIEFKITIEDFVDPEAGQYDSSKRQTGSFTLSPEAVEVPVNYGAEIDLTEDVQKYLQLTKYELTQLGAPTVDDETGELLKGLQVVNYLNGEPVKSTANGRGGNWFDANFNVVVWGEAEETRAFFVELGTYLDWIGTSIGCEIGNDAAAGLVGKTLDSYKQVITYIPDYNEAPTEITVEYTIKFVEAVEE